MKQILLRVPEETRRKLAARATRAGRSINSVANEILDAAVDADLGDRRTRLRARAASLGVLRNVPAPVVPKAHRRGIISSTTGIGPFVDAYLTAERAGRDRLRGLLCVVPSLLRR